MRIADVRRLETQIAQLRAAFALPRSEPMGLEETVERLEQCCVTRSELASVQDTLDCLEKSCAARSEVTSLQEAVRRLEIESQSEPGLKETHVEEMDKVIGNLSHIEASLKNVMSQMGNMVSADEMKAALSEAAARHAAELSRLAPDTEFYQAWFASAASDDVQAEVRIHNTSRRTEDENKAWLNCDSINDTSVENRDSWMGLADENWQLRGNEYTKVYYKAGEWSGGVKIHIHLKFKDKSHSKSGAVCRDAFQQLYPLLEWERVLLSVKQAGADEAPTTA